MLFVLEAPLFEKRYAVSRGVFFVKINLAHLLDFGISRWYNRDGIHIRRRLCYT